MDTIYSIFIKLRNKQEDLAFEHEEQSSYEMAYLARWYVLEKILKILHTQRKADGIHNKVCDWWEEYLLNSVSSKPEPLKSLSLNEPHNIPQVGDIEMHLDCELPIVKEIMHPKSGSNSTKWRKQRNDIAHRAEQFGSIKKYNEYRKPFGILVDILYGYPS